MQFDKELMERQDEVNKLVKETADKLLEMTTVDMIDAMLVDFIGSLIDYCLSVKATTMLYGLYKYGEMSRKELYETIDRLNLRPRYKGKIKSVIDEIMKRDEREVV